MKIILGFAALSNAAKLSWREFECGDFFVLEKPVLHDLYYEQGNTLIPRIYPLEHSFTKQRGNKTCINFFLKTTYFTLNFLKCVLLQKCCCAIADLNVVNEVLTCAFKHV